MKIDKKRLNKELTKIAKKKNREYRTLTYNEKTKRFLLWYTKKDYHAYEFDNIVYVFEPGKCYTKTNLIMNEIMKNKKIKVI